MGLKSGASARLAYDAQTRSAVPIPPSERALQTTVAASWFKVSDEGRILEGAIFDRSGNLLLCDVSGRRVLRLTPDKQLSTIVTLDALAPGGWPSTRTGASSSRRWTFRMAAART
ncbi:hypothetical protein LMG31506_04883 [Cupriavidus yeoncheonensis]|uniref:Uncharacterized protein n=2 Tax=Cupriavidus yeoncheonensis TaxID=1462994 RepID=A0A916N5Y8_9BURK|nr:hypothetical protein LMG31506_04883 [Cupriavidus yeoncheonensis]